MNRTRKAIMVFLTIETIIVCLFSALIIIDGRGLSQNIPYMLVLMFSPAIVAMASSLIVHGNLHGFGWKIGKPKYLWVAYLTPLLYILITYGFALAFGLVNLEPDAANQLGPTEVLQFFLVNILILCVLVAGEEIGWRGFLLPQLCKITSFAKASAFVGLFWVLVHFPIFIFADYNAGSAPLLFRLVCFSLLAFGVNIAINWLRMRSGSVWTAVLFHATHNSFLQDITPYFEKTEVSAYILSESGFALALGGVVVGAIFGFKKINRTPATLSQT